MVGIERGEQARPTGLLDFEIGEEDDLQGQYLEGRTRDFFYIAALLRGFRARQW